MTRRRGPTKRLLILPALLTVAMLVAVHVVHGAVPREVDPALQVEGLPPVGGEELRCSRGDDESVLREIRAQFDPNGRITSAIVFACPVAYDGMGVRYVGELVGDLFHRDDGAWATVNDDDYALEVGPLAAHRDNRGTNSGLTVWLPDHLLPAVTGLGQPNQRGDVVEVRGQIVRTDPADGGGLTLRAQSLEVLAPATAVTEPFDLAQAWLAIAAIVVAAVLWAVRRRAARL